MTCFIKDMHRHFKSMGRAGKEPHVLKARYNVLLPVDKANVQAEYPFSLRRTLSADGARSSVFDGELELGNGRIAAENFETARCSQLRCFTATQAVLYYNYTGHIH